MFSSLVSWTPFAPNHSNKPTYPIKDLPVTMAYRGVCRNVLQSVFTETAGKVTLSSFSLIQ